jgi:hypothetical protein
LPSLQPSAPPPTHDPPLHASPVVQASPSLHAAVLFACAHPLAGLQESSVQPLPSSQLSAGPPTHAPPLHASPVVHALPSLQAAALFVWTHPVAGLQESSVQPLLSLQSSAGPPAQAPPLQVSTVVHALPSLQAAALLLCTHPVARSHESSVQGLPSSQLNADEPAHTPPEQTSPVEQGSPSSQGALLFAWTQPFAGLQESSVHPLASSQSRAGPAAQAPPLHASAVVQALPSSQGAKLFAWTQPLAGSQESSVHPLPSLQPSAGPPTQAPPLHTSAVVQAFPSLHAAALFACTQPVAGLQESSVQTLASPQLSAAPPTHAPPLQVSPVVHALPSLHAAALLLCIHPVARSHESSVQGLPSSQLNADEPAHTPPEQTSPVEQGSPSSQGALLFAWTQPLAGLQESSVHPLASSQSRAGPAAQAPPLHASAVVQALPSSQGAKLFVWTHPVAGLQESSVQTLPSSQPSAGPPTQAPPLHASAVVQALPSSHAELLFK